jgi:uncharacterized caspase-like protein
MPHEADTESIGTTCLNWTEVVKKLDAVKAQRIIVVLDCCHSGAFHAKVPNQTGLAEALRANKAALVICASGPDQSALERDDVKHGIFTFAMLEAMQGKGDADKDGAITVQEMVDYVKPLVRKLSANKQDAEIFATQAKTDVPIAFVPPTPGAAP